MPQRRGSPANERESSSTVHQAQKTTGSTVVFNLSAGQQRITRKMWNTDNKSSYLNKKNYRYKIYTLERWWVPWVREGD